MSTPELSLIHGRGGKPSWAPSWAPSKATLDYLEKLAGLLFLILGGLYFLGLRELKPFANRHIAEV